MVQAIKTTRRVQAGLFEVDISGAIYRFCDTTGNRIKCPLVINKDYYAVTTSIKGEQFHYYAHRLIAEAFVPNPEHKRLVRFKDGNKDNLSVDNLIWQNHADIPLTNTTGVLSRGGLCDACGSPTLSRINTICKPCRYADRKQKAKTQKLERIKQSFDGININQIEGIAHDYITMRLTGCSYQDIANTHDVTRQAVHIAIKRVVDTYRLFKYET